MNESVQIPSAAFSYAKAVSRHKDEVIKLLGDLESEGIRVPYCEGCFSPMLAFSDDVYICPECGLPKTVKRGLVDDR